MKRYAAVIFDWDGTLMDSTHSIVSSIQGACRDVGLPEPSDEQARWVIGLSLESALYRAVPDLGADQLPRFLECYRKRFLQLDGRIRFFDGIPEMLTGLRRSKVLLGVATGKSRAGLDRILTAQSWHDRFDATRCADESQGKPHPAMLLELMDTLSLEPEQVLMVGDTTHDVHMAANAGVDSLAVSYGAHDARTLAEAAPTVMVDSVPQMAAWLSERIVPRK